MDPDPTSLTPLPGGWSGETFLAEVAGERTVVRIYARPSLRGPAAHEVDAALLRLVRGLLPVAEVLELRRADAATGLPALLVTSFLPGVRGDLLLPELDADGLARVGARLGDLVADLGGMPMLSAGPFVDSRLSIGSFGGGPEGRSEERPGGVPGEVPGEGPDDGLPGFVDAHAAGLWHLTPDELAGLRAVALDAQALLDTEVGHRLVHGDLNPKNLLLDPATLEVTGLVDWEFAHAGHRFTDLGNLLRFDRDPGLTAAVLETYAARRGTPPERALALARAADLWALVDLAVRRLESPVGARADRLLRAIARTRDPGAPEEH